MKCNGERCMVCRNIVAQFCVGACSIRTSSHSQLGKLTMKEQDIEKTTLADHELTNCDKKKDGEDTDRIRFRWFLMMIIICYCEKLQLTT